MLRDGHQPFADIHHPGQGSSLLPIALGIQHIGLTALDENTYDSLECPDEKGWIVLKGLSPTLLTEDPRRFGPALI